MVNEKIVERRVRQRNEALKNLGLSDNGFDNKTETVNGKTRFKKSYSTYSLNRLYTLVKNASESNAGAYTVVNHTGELPIEGNRIKVFIKKALRKILRTLFGWYIIPIHERQTVYNVQTNASIANLLKACEWQRRMLSELNRRTEYMEAELAAKDEKISELTEKLAESSEKTELLAQQLSALDASCIKKDGESGKVIIMSDEQRKYFDYICEKLNITYDPALIENGKFDYFEFENVFRGSEELIKERQRQYIPYLKTESSDGYVLELGFGRGELLALMKENEINAVGVDCYPPFVKYCKDRGYDVYEGDALTYLTGCEDESLNGIILSQVAEHVGEDYLYQLIRTGYKKLRVGCPFIIETPNAETLSTFTEFYIDGTHVKPVSYHTLNFVFRENGYSEVVRLENEYSKHPLGEEMQTLIIDRQTDEKAKEFYTRLKTMMFGARDCTIIARK